MEEFLTPQEIATRWRVNAYTIRRWIATGALAAETIKEGKRNRHRVRKSLIEALEVSSSPAAIKHPL
jgi:predicted site-specific integrase-resolvase